MNGRENSGSVPRCVTQAPGRMGLPLTEWERQRFERGALRPLLLRTRSSCWTRKCMGNINSGQCEPGVQESLGGGGAELWPVVRTEPLRRVEARAGVPGRRWESLRARENRGCSVGRQGREITWARGAQDGHRQCVRGGWGTGGREVGTVRAEECEFYMGRGGCSRWGWVSWPGA